MSYEVKADPLEAAFDNVAEAPAAVQRPVLAGAATADPARAAFVDGFLRRGSEVELKSVSGVVMADGGFAVPREIDAQIDATLKSISPIRSIANVVRVGTAGYRKLVTVGGTASGWAAENAPRPETGTPQFNEIVPNFGDLYANPAATQAMLDDAEFDVESWLADEIATEFAKAEGSAFVNGNGAGTAPVIVAAAAGTMPGWRRASLLQSNDGGMSFQEIGQTAPAATLGSALTGLGAGTSVGFDQVSIVDVQLLHGAMLLNPSTEDGLVSGQNLAKLGDELFQFHRAELIGPARYRLSGLLRGRRGTEWAMAAHVAGEPFAVIESDSLLPLTVPEGTATVLASASGISDPVAADASLAIQGHAIRPFAPVLLRALPAVAGGTLISWVRRSRDGWRWVDHVDAPLVEESERYEVTVTPQPGLPRTTPEIDPHYTYTAAEQAADVSLGATSLLIEVRQIGTYGPSRPASILLPL